MAEIKDKLEKLRAYFKELGKVAIAFSGGVDSTFMLSVAHEVLKDNVLAVTAVSPLFPQRERLETEKFCRERGIRQVLIYPEHLNTEAFITNPPNRCYLCKYAFFSQIKKVAEEHRIPFVAEGSNMDDLTDYRPGLRAVAELEIKSPLRYVELSKQEIRYLSKDMGLPTWDKPSFACLASRFAYGEAITAEKLQMIEKAENLLSELGFVQLRVRLHGTMARIEIPVEDFEKIMHPEIRKKIYDAFSGYGFSYTTLDLKGYRTGSMNEPVLEK